ncbi:hypothetical protein H4218_002625 [Coemansia sp. IMI 209128]|nr:hypothetical protein H4218_002625 [Coemansia sp. IMI 209128]
MRPRTASCWALGVSVLAAASAVHAGSDIPHERTAGPLMDNGVAGLGEFERLYQRGILDDLANLFNPTRVPRADDDESASGGAGNSDDNNPPPTTPTSATTPTSTTETTPTTPTSKTTTTPTSRTTPTSTTEEATSTTTTRTSNTRTSNTRTSNSRTSNTGRTTEELPTTDEPEETTTTSSTKTTSSGLVIVTYTRPDRTITTNVPPPPIIDQSDGDKADVGAPSNLTTVIVAPIATAVALLLCAIMYYMYSKRKNRVKYGDEDIFAKGAAGRHSEGSPFSQSDTSPFVPPEHSSNARADGYIKEAPGFHSRVPPPLPPPLAPRATPSFGANPVMANPRYQQQAVPLVPPGNRPGMVPPGNHVGVVQPGNRPGVVPGTAHYMPQPVQQVQQAQPRYGAMQNAPGYPPAAGDRGSQFTDTYAYEPPAHTSNNSYNGNSGGGGGRQPHPGYGSGHRG